MISKKSKIFIAGHNGMVGKAILKKLKENGYKNLIIISKNKLNLLDQWKVFKFLKKTKPNLVIIAAARVGGIYANYKNKAKFIYENLQIQNNLIHGSYLANIKDLIFLGSSCIYPKYSKQPIKEKYILSGSLEETNDAYAIAKIAGIYMCENYSKNYKLNYRSFMPSNMYGPYDNYDSKNSHFFSALLKKVYYAKKNNKKSIVIWGDGSPKRELLFVDDFADAILYFLNIKLKNSFINIGPGVDHTIKWYVKFICKQLNIDNIKILFDKKKPNGTPRKLLDVKLAKSYGWKAKTTLKKGFQITYEDFKLNKVR